MTKVEIGEVSLYDNQGVLARSTPLYAEVRIPINIKWIEFSFVIKCLSGVLKNKNFLNGNANITDALCDATGTYWAQHWNSEGTVFSITRKLKNAGKFFNSLVNFKSKNQLIQFKFKYENFEDVLNRYYAEVV